MRRLFLLLVFFVLIVITITQAVAESYVPFELTLLSTMRADEEELPLRANQWAFLRRKGVINLGVVEPGLSPLEIVRPPDFKGVTADVASLLSSKLHTKLRVMRYANRDQAIEALTAGQVDLLAGASSMSTAPNSIVLSVPYAVDTPVIYRRMKDARVFPEDLAGMRVAFTDGYLDEERLAAQYPLATFLKFHSNGQAMASTAFEKTDLFLGDSLSARYLINHSYFNYVKIERLLPIDTYGFAFALREADEPLLGIVNTALKAIGKAKLEFLSRRWVGGAYDLPEEKLQLTVDEQAWLQRHPIVRLAVNDDQAPIAFVDREGNFNGMAADILDLVTQRTGLRFSVERVDDFASLAEAVRDGKADLSVISRTPERDAIFRFSPPFVTTTFALLTRTGEVTSFGQLKDLKGKRLAIARGHACIKDIEENYPEIMLVKTATSLDSLKEVAAGKAEAAVIGLILGRYYISKFYDDKLAVSGIVDDDTAFGNFAMRRADIELQAILSKVILDIPPEEMNTIASRWRPNPAMSGQTWWDHRQRILLVVLLAALLIGMFALWALYLRRQVAKRIVIEKALNDQLKLVEALSDATPQPIYVRDLRGKLVGATRSYEVAVGATVKQLQGKTVVESTEKFGAAGALHQAYMQAMENNVATRMLRTVRMNEEQRWIDHWIQPFHNSAGVMQGVICGWLDVTEQQRLILELEQARELAVQASQEKSNFLAMMSHEIRTPLSAVIGTLELVQRQAAEGVLDQQGIEIAASCANGLLSLIGDVLDIVRIESGRLTLAPERANLRELIESVALLFDGLARQKGLSLTLELDSSIGQDVLVDPVRVKQILSNLVSNAIKFTKVGHVKISAISQPIAEDRIRANITVSDTGVGISQYDQERLFRPFSQINQATTGRLGAGLGLKISQSLCKLMGGGLLIHSTPDVGTDAVVELALYAMEPMATDDISTVRDEHSAESRQGDVEQTVRSCRILVVDDIAVHRQLLCQQLAFLGHEADAVEDGQLAFERWKVLHFDMVITDCQMPGMNGIDLAQAIRREEKATGRPPCVILGLTADAQQQEIERCLAAGMNECIVKPMGLDALKVRVQAIPARVSSNINSDKIDGISSPISTLGSDPFVDKPLEVRGLDVLLKLTGGDLGKTKELVREVMKSLEDAQARLHQSNIQQDFHAIATLAHQLLGVARVLSHAQLEQVSLRMEHACLQDFPSNAEVLDISRELTSMLGEMYHCYLHQLDALSRGSETH